MLNGNWNGLMVLPYTLKPIIAPLHFAMLTLLRGLKNGHVNLASG
jgi:hypothetical protein